MKFPSREISGVQQIYSEERESFTDELSVIVLKENFLNSQYQVQEIRGIPFEELDYVEGASNVLLSLVIQKLLQLGLDFSNYQMFYQAQNSCFFYVGVFPNLSEAYVPFILPRKILIKIRQCLYHNNEVQNLPQKQEKQKQTFQNNQKEENLSEGLQEDNTQVSLLFQDENNDYQKINKKEDFLRIKQNKNEKNLKQIKIGLIVNLIRILEKSSDYQTKYSELIAKYGINKKIISQWSQIIRRTTEFGFNLNNHSQNNISVIYFYYKCHLKAQKFFKENSLDHFKFQKLAKKSVRQCKTKNCCIPVSLQSRAKQMGDFQ